MAYGIITILVALLIVSALLGNVAIGGVGGVLLLVLLVLVLTGRF